MGLRRASHAVYDTTYHLVWCPKYRKKVFKQEDIRERADQLIREICEEHRIAIGEMEVAIDHIHILISFPPRYSIGEVVRIIKSNSTRGLFREFPRIKKKLWEDGYFARTVGVRMTRQIIDKYIKHHRDLEKGPAQLF